MMALAYDCGHRGDAVKIRLREWRLRKVMTQAELAERTGMTEATISRLESGHQDARISTVKKLAAGLGIEPTELIVEGKVAA